MQLRVHLADQTVFPWPEYNNQTGVFGTSYNVLTVYIDWRHEVHLGVVVKVQGNGR